MCTEKGHETEPLDHYCKYCKVSICDRCGKTRHTQHTKVNIQQATEEEKLKMEETVKQMKMQISELETQITETTKTLAISKEKNLCIRNSVQTIVEELIHVLREHERSMVTKLDVLEEAQQRDYTGQVESLQNICRRIKNLCEKLRGNVKRRHHRRDPKIATGEN